MRIEPVEKKDVRKERISIAITENELLMIDLKASEKNMSRTEFIVRACEAAK